MVDRARISLLATSVVAFLAPAVVAIDSDPFSAVIVPDGPIRVDSTVLSVPSFEFFANVTAPNLPLGERSPMLKATQLSITVFDGTPQGVRLPEDRQPATSHFEDALVWLDSSEPASYWQFYATSGTDAQLAASPAGCNITRTRSVPSDYYGVAVAETPTTIGLGWLQAECRLSPLNVTGSHLSYVTGVNITVDYANGVDGHGVPRRAQAHFDVGTYTEPDPLVPNKEYAMRRVARISTTAEDARMSLADQMDVTWTSPRLFTVGSLALPTGNGSVDWGRAHMGPALDALQTAGAFMHATSGSNAIAIDGQAYVPVVAAPNEPAAVLPPSINWLPAAVGGAVALLVLMRGWPLLLGLFSRLTQDRALDHERRRVILDLVQQNPGARVQDVARSLNLHWSIASYHVHVLDRQGLLHRRRTGRETLLYVGPFLNATKMEELRRLRHPTVQSLLEALDGDPTQTQAQLAARIGVRQPRVSRLIGDLERLGVVRCERTGRGRAYIPVHGAATSPAAVPAPVPAVAP